MFSVFLISQIILSPSPLRNKLSILINRSVAQLTYVKSTKPFVFDMSQTVIFKCLMFVVSVCDILFPTSSTFSLEMPKNSHRAIMQPGGA